MTSCHAIALLAVVASAFLLHQYRSLRSGNKKATVELDTIVSAKTGAQELLKDWKKQCKVFRKAARDMPQNRKRILNGREKGPAGALLYKNVTYSITDVEKWAWGRIMSGESGFAGWSGYKRESKLKWKTVELGMIEDMIQACTSICASNSGDKQTCIKEKVEGYMKGPLDKYTNSRAGGFLDAIGLDKSKTDFTKDHVRCFVDWLYLDFVHLQQVEGKREDCTARNCLNLWELWQLNNCAYKSIFHNWGVGWGLGS